ncbi:MAG: Nramp family divalent metal transporter [Planctomycetota bacterium]|jgi:Mn2+/Fe2+ NRAMP family transporter
MNQDAATPSGSSDQRPTWLAIVVPGFLVAATGIGAGDLATGAFTGSKLGVAVLWAVVVGGVFKFAITEGLARWQLVTGQTLLEGLGRRLGPGGKVALWVFLAYLLLWSYFVGVALTSACGVTLHAMIPLFEEATQGKVAFGAASSLAGLALVLGGGYALFEKVMGVCIGVMFSTVLLTAALLWPGAGEVLGGLFAPTIPRADGEGVTWTLALIGGVGGTVTVLCYGYWIREADRSGEESIGVCRLDLGIGYATTVLFGLAMVIIGATIEIEGSGAGLLVELASRLEDKLGLWGRWLFLIGAFGAVFSSLLGVWQAVPYLFADVCRLLWGADGDAGHLADTRMYRVYLLVLAFGPMVGLVGVGFEQAQKVYAVTGSLFIPLLALTLLVMNGRFKWVGDRKNGALGVIGLCAVLVFFGVLGWMKWLG